FHLEAFSDSDYAGAAGDRKSTTGGCQYLGRRLISWQCKKQTIVATSSCEAEYVAAASCCGQVAFLEKTKRKSDRFHDIIDFINSTPIRYALVTNPIVRESLVRQFWATASEVSLPDGTVGIEATIDGHAHTITEASIRSSLRLNDQGATVCLPTDDIYSGLAAIGYVPDQGVWRLCFFKNKFSPQWKFLVHTLIHCIDSKEVPQMHPDPTPSTLDPPVTESAHAPSLVVTSSGPTVDPGQSSSAPVVTQGMGSSGSTPVVLSDPLSTPVLSPIIWYGSTLEYGYTLNVQRTSRYVMVLH
ncbi:hypothetical protein Tco_1342520, partial [Tanacetum coccineum]